MSQQVRSQDWSETLPKAPVKANRDLPDQEILVHIANFGAQLGDLQALFGLASDPETEAARGAALKAARIPDQEISRKLRVWKGEELITTAAKRRGQGAFYLCTDEGMEEAGFANWSVGLSWPRDAERLDRGGSRGRLVASVATAVRIILEREALYGEMSLLSVWGIRRRGRISSRYRFETGKRHLPALVISPRRSSGEKPTVIEVFDGSLNSSEMKTFCHSSNESEDVGSLRCYVTETDLSAVRRIVRDFETTRKITVVAIPEGADALAIAGLEGESIPCASELTADERRLQQTMLRRVGEFGSVSETGLMELFGAEDKREVKRILDVAVGEKLLSTSPYLCDGVKLMWLTEAGASRSKTKALSEVKTLEAARLEKDSVRVAALLTGRFPRGLVANSRTMTRAGKAMPTIGPTALAVRPVFLVRKDKADKSPVAVIIVNEIRTEAQLAELVSACIADRCMSQILIYAARTVITVLKGIVGAQDKDSRISVKPLPVSERVQQRRVVEVKRSAAEEQRQAVKGRRLAREAASAAKPRTRRERHVAGLPGEKPVSDAMWNAFSAALHEKVEGKEGNQAVSWRLVVNLLIWLVENEQSPAVLRSARHRMSANTFRRRLDAVHKAGMWQQLQRLVGEHIAAGHKRYGGPETLNWQLIKPAIKSRDRGSMTAAGRRVPVVSLSGKEITWL